MAGDWVPSAGWPLKELGSAGWGVPSSSSWPLAARMPGWAACSPSGPGSGWLPFVAVQNRR